MSISPFDKNKHSRHELTPDFVLEEFCMQGIGIKGASKDIEIPEGKFSAYVNSERYLIFQARGLSCVSCGRKANVCLFSLPGKDQKDNRGHFNFFIKEGDNYTLMTKDHIIPKAKGGKDVLANYVPMCQECNTQKSSKCTLDALNDAIEKGTATALPMSIALTVPKNIANDPAFRIVIQNWVEALGGKWTLQPCADGKIQIISEFPFPISENLKQNMKSLINIVVYAKDYKGRHHPITK